MRGKPHHYGVTVSDIETMQEFYVDCLGMEETGRMTLDGETVSTITGVEGEREVSFLQAGEFAMELIEYDSPEGKNANDGVRNSDVGATHFCLQVEDARELYDDLSDDVEFISPPQDVGSATCVYAFDPDGNVVEFGSFH